MEVARRAEGWLDSIRQNKAEKLNDLDYVREQMIMYIQACLGQPAMNGTQQ
jgi:hypothetical protein